MQVLKDLKQKVNTLIGAGIYSVLQETFNDSTVKAQIEDKITEQLSRGETGTGEKMRDYSPVSVAKYGKPAGPIRLFDEGNFYRGVLVLVDREGITIVNTDPKTEMLVDEFGHEIIELQEESLEELKEEVIIPNMQERILQFFE